MKKYLPILIVLLVILGLEDVKLSTVLAQGSDSTVSDYQLDIQQGEKDTTNDVDAQDNQQGVNEDEEVEVAADDGDPNSELVSVIADQIVAPEEAQESAQLVENPQATTSENDNGETLNQQATQNTQDQSGQADSVVNTKDDNQAPTVDAESQPQAPQEQSMESIQQSSDVQNQSSQTQPAEQPQPQESPDQGQAQSSDQSSSTNGSEPQQ